MKITLFSLLMALPLFLSCEKDDNGNAFGNNNALVGDWLNDKVEVHCDGKLVGTDINQVNIESSGNTTSVLLLRVGVSFTKDGDVSALGKIVGTYTYSNGVIKYSPKEPKESTIVFTLKNNVLILTETHTYDSPATVTIPKTKQTFTAKKIEYVYYFKKQS